MGTKKMVKRRRRWRRRKRRETTRFTSELTEPCPACPPCLPACLSALPALACLLFACHIRILYTIGGRRCRRRGGTSGPATGRCRRGGGNTAIDPASSASASTMRDWRLIMTDGEWAMMCRTMRNRVRGHEASGHRSAKWSRHRHSAARTVHGPSYWLCDWWASRRAEEKKESKKR